METILNYGALQMPKVLDPQSFINSGLGTEEEFNVMVHFLQQATDICNQFSKRQLRPIEIAYYMTKSLNEAQVSKVYEVLENWDSAPQVELEQIHKKAYSAVISFLEKTRMSMSEYKAKYDLSLAALASQCRENRFYDNWEFCNITHFLIR